MVGERLPYAIPLVGSGVPPSVAGAKGAALDRLVALGSPVPPSAVLTTAAYRAFVADPALQQFLATVGGAPGPDADAPGATAGEVDEKFLAAPMPADVATAIAQVARQIGAGGPLAIRSSATAEDLREASFAGQYRS
jgi:pyruvate,water dikinase